MPVGLLTLELHIPDAHSLKDKRAIIRPILEGCRRRYQVAAAEVDHTDRWQRAARERGAPQSEGGDDGTRAEVERRALLAGLVSRLPKDQQRVVLERFVEQKSIREIAQELRRTEGAVKQLQFRALESLRARMRDVHD